MRNIVNLRYRLFQRSNGIFFIEDRVTGKQASLKTRDKAAALRIFNAKNESYQQPAVNLQIARAYLMAVDALVVGRSWQNVMKETHSLHCATDSRKFPREPDETHL